MYQSEIFYTEMNVGEKNHKEYQQHHINPVPATSPVSTLPTNMDMNYVNLLRENFELRERNNQLIKINNSLMIEISQLKLDIDILELKKALAQDDR